MSHTDKLREFGQKVMREYGRWWGIEAKDADKFVSDLTALISENYVERAKYDEAVRQRDELKQKLSEIFAICEDGQELNMSNYNHDDVSALNQTFVEIYIAVEAAIKNTEG